MHSVPFPYLIIAIRNQNISTVFYCADQQLDLELAVHICKRHADKPAFFLDRIFDQLHSSSCECLYLARIGEQQKPADLVGHDQFRIDRHAKMQILFQESDLLKIDRIAHTGDRMSCTKPPCDKTT